MRDFTETKAALARYDRLNDEFCKDLALLSNKEAWELYVSVMQAKRAAAVAFIEATSDVNSPDKAEVVGIEFIRKMANKEA